MSLSQEQAVEHLGNLKVTELLDLTKTLEDKWGVKAAPTPTALPAPEPCPGCGFLLNPGVAHACPGGAQTEFSVTLADAGAKKIDVIKAVREVLGLGLAEAKAFAEGAPKLVKEGVTKAEADEIRTKLEAAGAKVEVK